MQILDSIEKSIIPIPSWDNVRPIYRKLSDEFHILLGSYDLKITNERKLRLDHLIIAIDEVDKCIDELPTKNQRDSITESMISFFENSNSIWQHPSATQTLAEKIENLKRVIQKENVIDEFVDAASTIFYFTEIKRHTTSRKDLLRYICEEGKATARLPLSILKIDQTHPFSIFFTRLCKLMGIADLVIDAQDDFKKNYITLKPGFGLYWSLNLLLIKDGFKLLINFPKKMKFFAYCIRFSWALFRE